jgi:NAD(P)-dependent dehydrogenase (short-subunit alcohol dehydrogenase family)
MALATVELFVEEGAYVFIKGRRQDKLDEAVKLIGKNVTGVQGDASNLADLDRLYESIGPSQDNSIKSWNAVDSLSWTVGRHSLRFGVDYLWRNPSTFALGT